MIRENERLLLEKEQVVRENGLLLKALQQAAEQVKVTMVQIGEYLLGTYYLQVVIMFCGVNL